MIITTRLSAGSYVARAKGNKATSSSAESARAAGATHRPVEGGFAHVGMRPVQPQLEGTANPHGQRDRRDGIKNEKN